MNRLIFGTFMTFLTAASIGCFSKQLIKDDIAVKRNNWDITISQFKAGPDTYSYRMGDFEYTRFPKNQNHGFLWMKLTVVNREATRKSFDFSRIRLIADEYITNPSFIFSDALFYKEGFLLEVKPGDSITRWVIFIHYKEMYPTRMVYDMRIGSSIFDSITIDLPIIAASVEGTGVSGEFQSTKE